MCVRACQKLGATRGVVSDGRAGKQDAAQRIACPTLTLRGQDLELVGHLLDVEAIWREVATEPRAVSMPRCGHLPHKGRPEQVNAALLEFLEGWTD